MVAHSALTGSNLHEPKGVASAASGTVYVADGAGSGTWATLTTSSLNSGSLKNINKYKAYAQFDDISTADFLLIPVPEAAVLDKVTVILHATISGGDSTLTFTNSTGPVSLGTLIIANTGSAEGTIFTFTPGANSSFTAGTYLKIDNDGGSSTTSKAILLLEWTLS